MARCGQTKDAVGAPGNNNRNVRGQFMSGWKDELHRHTAELVKLTPKAADQGPEPLTEDEVANLEARCGESSMPVSLRARVRSRLGRRDMELDRVRRGRVLKLVKRHVDRVAGDGTP